jgi:hypothetical protein
MSLSNKIKLILNEYDKIKTNIQKISPILVKKLDYNTQQEITNYVNKLNNITIIDSYINNNMILEELFEIWHLTEYVLYLINQVVDQINLLIQNAESVIFDQQINININLIYNMLYKKINNDNKLILQTIINQVKWDQNTIIKQATNYTSYIKKSPFSILLYVQLMQQSLKYCIQYSKNLCNVIINMIDDVKNFIMLYEIPQSKTTKNLYNSNPRLKTFGLTPRGPVTTLLGIFKYVYGDISKKLTTYKEKNLSNLAKEKGICIIMFNSVTKKPMEFKLWKMINWGYAKDFIQDENAGINIKTIERYTTSKFLDNQNIVYKWNFNTEYYGDISSDLFIILEHMGNNAYRQLSIYIYDIPQVYVYNKNKTTGGKSLNVFLHRNRINNIITYVKNKGVLYNNTLTSEYHKIQESLIIKNMFLPTQFNLNDIKTDSQQLDSAFLKHNLLNELVNVCVNLCKKLYKNGTTIKNIIDVGKIIHNEELSNTFNMNFIKQYKIFITNKTITNKFPTSELLQTLLAQLRLINRDFIRDVHYNFILNTIDPAVFKESSINKIAILKKLFEKIIEPVLCKLISNEKNIYQALIYKNSLLNLSIY